MVFNMKSNSRDTRQYSVKLFLVCVFQLLLRRLLNSKAITVLDGIILV